MAIQLVGLDGTSVQAVDPTFKAARVSMRPLEVKAWQSVGAMSGVLTGVAANGAIFSLRNISANLIMVRRIGIGFVAATAFTAAQKVDYGVTVARAMTTSDTGGTAISLVGNNAKYRTSLDTMTSVDCRISTTGILTAGTKTLDANPLAVCGGWVGAVGQGIAPSANNLLSHDACDHPIILAQNEGINILNLTLMGAGGTGTAYVNIEFGELVSY